MNYKRLFALLFLCVLCLSSAVLTPVAPKATAKVGTVKPDTWVAVDGLGRTISSYSDAGGTKKNKTVGVFYWSWHDYWGKNYPARNITEIISKNPEAKNDYNHAAWGGEESKQKPYFWNEPVYGYYKTSDKYVLRKQAELLADAGVDVIFFDCSNGTENYLTQAFTVFKAFEEAKAEGVNVPKISFVLSLHNNDDSTTQLKELYNAIYSKGKYQDMWFYWEGKPMLMARYAQLKSSDKTEKAIKEFFTFRRNEPTYSFADTTYADKAWGWCSVYPQTKYGVRSDGSVEQMCVSAAQNARMNGSTVQSPVAMNATNGGVFGRGYAKGSYSYSYTYQNKKITVNKNTQDAYVYGLNFQQQWDYALQVNPDFIFVTGWNEYVCQRLETYAGSANGFSDNFTDEFSRDIEPSKGILKDNFYYQLVSNIRKFKGVSKPETGTDSTNVAKTIDINSSTDQWSDVYLSFNHYTGSTKKRDTAGYSGSKYTSSAARNDIVTSKVAYDAEYIYFMVETAANLTSSSDKAWMRLLLDTDPSGVSKNWEGFEYIINRVSPTGSDAVIEKSTGGWKFTKVGTAKFTVKGNRLQIAVPRSAVGLTDLNKLSFNFKWADNTLADGASTDSGDIMDYYLYGDVAPGGRFMFSFTGTAKAKPVGSTHVPATQAPTQKPSAATEAPGTSTMPDEIPDETPGTDNPTDMEEETEESGLPGYIWGIIGGGAAVVIAAVIIIIIVLKKK